MGTDKKQLDMWHGNIQIRPDVQENYFQHDPCNEVPPNARQWQQAVSDMVDWLSEVSPVETSDTFMDMVYGVSAAIVILL